MAWTAIELTVAAPDADALSDALLAQGAAAADVSLPAGAEAQAPEDAAGTGLPAAGNLVLRALFPADADPAGRLARAAAAAGLAGVPPYRSARVEEQDWVRLTQAQFPPVQISPRLWIVPSWHAAPPAPAVTVTLDPGLAFGTGTHPSTRLCLAWLDAHIRGGEDVLDYGCGSGVLAIAALKLGARRATGLDIDPQAVEVARANAAQNHAAAQFHTPDAAPDLIADIVLANILAHPLVVLAPALARATRQGGRVVLAGLLERQAAEVAAAYAPWFDMAPAGALEGWVSLAGKKR